MDPIPMSISDVQICNMALQKLGAQSIVSLQDINPRAQALNNSYEMYRDRLQRMRWNFNRAYAFLPQIAAPPIYEYPYGYQLPADFLGLELATQSYPNTAPVSTVTVPGPPTTTTTTFVNTNPSVTFNVAMMSLYAVGSVLTITDGTHGWTGTVTGVTNFTVTALTTSALGVNGTVTSGATVTSQIPTSGNNPGPGYQGNGLPGTNLSDYNNSRVQNYRIVGRQIWSYYAPPLAIIYRQRVTDPNAFDSMFVECLAAYLAWQLCETIVSSDAKKSNMRAEYQMALAEAKFSKSIENAPEIIPDDTWLQARIAI